MPVEVLHSPITPASSDALGRDDPVWPLYVEEANKWDAALVKEWNHFVMESSKNLQEDNTAATASTLIEISKTLQLMASGAQSNITTPTISNFQPSNHAVLVNLVWFTSLSLSITVSLVAILVKQWCSGFIAESFTSPCHQARTRQARYQMLIDYHTKDIVLFLPVMMHSALGLFLLGLIIFLGDLCFVVSLAVSVVALLTGIFYVVTTILPLWVPFCPYNTPLSSPRLWGYCYRRWIKAWGHLRYFAPSTPSSPSTARFPKEFTPCRQDEMEISTKTTPDKYTGHALKWLIKHCRKTHSREQAIRAIAGVGSTDTILPLLEESQILLQVAQSFTACFTETPGNDFALKLKDNKDIETAMLHGKALTVLIRYTNVAPNPLLGEDQPDPFDDRTRVAVANRFHFLARYADSESASASGAIGLSAWHDFTEAEGEKRFRGGELLLQLCQLLQSKDSELPFDALLCALSTEAAYWEESIGSAPRRRLLRQLLSLLAGGESQDIQSKVACTFAVLALAMHDFPAKPGQAGVRNQRAREAALQYTKPGVMEKTEVNALLLFGLASILEHYEIHGLAEEDLEIHNLVREDPAIHGLFEEDLEIHGLAEDGPGAIAAIAEQLKRLPILDSNLPITIPAILPATFDVRAYVVDILVLYLHRPIISGKLRLTDNACTLLLEVVSHRTYVWLNHSHQLILPIAKILQEAGPSDLHRQCLTAMTEYWRTAPSQLDLRVLLDHDILHQLVSLMNQKKDPVLRTLAVSHFDSLTHHLQGSEWCNITSGEEAIIKFLNWVVEADLFDVLFTIYLHEAASEENRRFWTKHLQSIAKRDNPVSVVPEKLRAFFKPKLFAVAGVASLGTEIFLDDEEFKEDMKRAAANFWPNDKSPPLASEPVITNRDAEPDDQILGEGSTAIAR
ncbi:hypothetical protein BDV93DRAFT_594230 [Ceratobasidium sp. AG-I]|nr:hypothetical protein BDV93DRAFT_594230 [Ceratobasidium sp. AG-I]